jgi:hypothetical protein
LFAGDWAPTLVVLIALLRGGALTADLSFGLATTVRPKLSIPSHTLAPVTLSACQLPRLGDDGLPQARWACASPALGLAILICGPHAVASSCRRRSCSVGLRRLAGRIMRSWSEDDHRAGPLMYGLSELVDIDVQVFQPRRARTRPSTRMAPEASRRRPTASSWDPVVKMSSTSRIVASCNGGGA